MKKKWFLLGITFILILIIPVIIAQENGSLIDDNSALDSEQAKIDKAYQCLEDKIEDRGCSTLSSEEKVFSSLATGKCTSDLATDTKFKVDLKFTAQAALALDKSGQSTKGAEDWLLSQKTEPGNVIWFLEIESPQATSCTITYDSSGHDINIGSDRKIDSNAGSCLSKSEGDFWLRISPTCYDKEFEISCNQGFLTTLLFQKENSATIHVSEKTSSASAEGTTTEIVKSLCFSLGGAGACDYEGSLWAALVLDKLDNDVSSYLPFLITNVDEHEELLPEAFLALLTGFPDFENNVLLKQKQDSFWDESGDRFYDTALALFPFQNQERTEKTNSKNWLLDIQGSDGCWNSGNVRNTGFILYSIWPRGFFTGGGGTSELDCEAEGFFCMAGRDCLPPGEILSGYDCSGVLRCCDIPRQVETCFDLGGEVCNSNQECVGGTTPPVDDTSFGEVCCVGGSCVTPIQETECESSGGTCKSFDCSDNEESAFFSCETSSQTCCVPKSSSNGDGFPLYVWILVGLIILVIIGIIFRNKLRPYFLRFKSKFGRRSKGPRGHGPGRPGFPPLMPSHGGPHRGRPPRRILPPGAHRPHPGRTPPGPKPKKSGELDDVLKKLKEMGK